jgi:hypothetical protein
MYRTRFSPIVFASLGLVLSALGCDASGGGGTGGPVDAGSNPDRDAGLDGGDVTPGMDAGDGDGGGDGDGDGDAAPDAPVCITGCDEVGAECGVISDNCGGTIDCDPEGDNCEAPEVCNTATNQCGVCEPASCESLDAACGVNVPDGCGGTLETCGLGDCSSMGAQFRCRTDLSACECVPKSFSEVCSAFDRECGSFDDGCGNQIDCGQGERCGDFRACDADGEARSCGECIDTPEKRTLACEGRTCGTVVTADGCEYTCGAACTATCASMGACGAANDCKCPTGQACFIDGDECRERECLTAEEACGAQECGFADSGCGQVACGDNAGGCGAGQACADPTFNLDAPERDGQRVHACIATAQARALGKYLVRTHIFRNADTAIGEILSRAEALSLVTIERTSGSLRMIDSGCVATSIDENGGNPTLAPAYFNIPPVVVPITVSGSTWLRNYQVTPTGFTDARPPYCAADGTLENESAPDYDTNASDLVSTPTPDSGANKTWLAAQNPCTCPPMGADVSELPAESTSSSLTTVEDCRINDVDNDGRPGFTVLANAPLASLTTSVASLAQVKWQGTLLANGRHTGSATEAEARDEPVSRVFLSCGGTGALVNTACNAIDDVVDWGCGPEFNAIQFTRLSGPDLALTCQDFYLDETPDSIGDADQAAIDARFGAISGSSCTTNANCNAWEVCKSGACWPMTTTGACSSTEDTCRDGWACQRNACWPESCPAP